ncbi:MAG: molybdenum ABC transporter permease subunit [Lysobacteraceae bacterium]|nr:MAG: molybdenum ABC transporter permease subunit [Xanthomonadaceae bacterium]
MTLSSADFTALALTAQLAGLTTLVLLLVGTPLAWWLARSTQRWKVLIEAVVALPLVLPPTVIGFYLLIAFAPDGFVGQALNSLGLAPLVFTFAGLVVGSVIFSMPFVVQPLQNAFAAIGEQTLEAAATLGASPLDRFFSIAVPLAWPGYLTAAVLGFAHTVGEFGLVLMIGGNIPGETQTASISIYEHVESLQYGQAHALAATLLLFSVLVLIPVYALNRHVRMAGR